MIIITFIVSLFFAVNIGASGAASSMGIAYSSSAVSRRQAVWLSGLGLFLGAWLGGAAVIKMLSHGLVPTSDITLKVTLMILIAATVTLLFSNLLGIPLSTSEVTVGAYVGLGMATHHLFVGHLIVILLFWLWMPLIAFFASLGISRLLIRLKTYGKYDKKWVLWFVAVIGVVEAFSAGMNNVGNAMGPLVGAKLLSLTDALIIGGVFLSIGAMTLGRATLETNGKRIVSLSAIEGGFVSAMVTVLVIIASIFGIPVPMAQMTTCSILGIGTGKEGFGLYQKHSVKQILTVWAISPLISCVLAFGLIKVIVHYDLYTLVIMAGVCLSTLGLRQLKFKQNTKEPSLKQNV